MTVTNGKPASPLSTTVADSVNTTQALALASTEYYDYSEGFYIVNVAEEATPLFSYFTKAGRQINGKQYDDLGLSELTTSNGMEYKWDEKDKYNDTFVVNGTINNSATTLVLDSTAGLYADLVLVDRQSNERVRITSVDSATNLTVVRGFGTTAAAQITDNDVLQVIATASAAGTSSADSFYTANGNDSNYVQKFLTTLSEDDFTAFAKTKKGGLRPIDEKMIQHAEMIEKAVVFGEKKSTTIGGKKVYAMNGVVQHCLKGYTSDISSTLTRDIFEETIEPTLKYGSKSKIILCSSKARRAIRGLYEPEDFVRVSNIKDLDLNISKINISRGDFTIIEHPMLTADSGYDGVIFILDMENMKFVYPTGENMVSQSGVNGKTKFEINKATQTFAFTEGTFVTYMTMMLSNARAFGAITVC